MHGRRRVIYSGQRICFRLMLFLCSMLVCCSSPAKPTTSGTSDSTSGTDKTELAIHDQDEMTSAMEYYRTAIENLDRAIAAQDEKIDEETAKIFSSNLDIIDASIRESEEVVRQNPYDSEAKGFLLEAYQQKTDLLEQRRNLRSEVESWGKFFYLLWKKS